MKLKLYFIIVLKNCLSYKHALYVIQNTDPNFISNIFLIWYVMSDIQEYIYKTL
jgi:hypothetical protein